MIRPRIFFRVNRRGQSGEEDGALERVETLSVDRHVGAVAPVVGGGYVLAAGAGFLFVDEAGSIHELAQPAAIDGDVRMNDGACDPRGRFWAGTMAYDESPGAGALYRLSSFKFPFRLNEVTRAYFQQMAKIEKGPLAADLANC